MKDLYALAHSGGNYCNIHENARFLIDDDCPICIKNENDKSIAPYIERIDDLERRLRKVINKHRVLELKLLDMK